MNLSSSTYNTIVIIRRFSLDAESWSSWISPGVFPLVCRAPRAHSITMFKTFSLASLTFSCLLITRAFRRKRPRYKFGFVFIFVFCVQSQNAVLLQRMRNYYVITRAHAMVHGSVVLRQNTWEVPAIFRYFLHIIKEILWWMCQALSCEDIFSKLFFELRRISKLSWQTNQSDRAGSNSKELKLTFLQPSVFF